MEITSKCCGAKSDCKEHLGDEDVEIICPDCEGTGVVEIIDKYRVWDGIVDIPYKKIDCPRCEGEGVIDVVL